MRPNELWIWPGTEPVGLCPRLSTALVVDLLEEEEEGVGIASDVKTGLGFVQTNVRIQWNPVYKTFHRIRLCGNERSCCSNSNEILKRQICGHRSSRVAGSKRRALSFYFPVRIWCMFPISKCRGKLDLGVCMISVLAKRMRPHSADFRFKNVFDRRIRRKSALRSRILFASTEIMHTPRSDFPLHFNIENKHQIRTEKQNASARHLLPATLLEVWLQICRFKITFEYCRTTASFPRRRIR